ncbi:hypothetical protein ACJX0J_030246, partial [Zea mays]
LSYSCIFLGIAQNDIIYVGVMLHDARHARKEARFNEGFPIFCIASHLKLLKDIGNKFNLIINLNVSIQKTKVKHIHQMKVKLRAYMYRVVHFLYTWLAVPITNLQYSR